MFNGVQPKEKNPRPADHSRGGLARAIIHAIGTEALPE